MTAKANPTTTRLIQLTIVLFILSTICWILIAYAFVKYFGGNASSSVTNFYNAVFIIARVSLCLAIVSLVLAVSPKPDRLRNAAAVVGVILLGVVVFQVHENSIQGQTQTQCLAVTRVEIAGAARKGDPFSVTTSNGMIEACNRQ